MTNAAVHHIVQKSSSLLVIAQCTPTSREDQQYEA
jgi:hypothetical protein